MSIKILTLKEAEVTRQRCERYNECFYGREGIALKDYFCDNSVVEIPKGTKCVACVVLPSKSHPNYQHQVDMLGEYVK